MNDINTLMERIQVINHKDAADLTPNDIDALVSFYRQRRTQKTAMNRSHDKDILDAVVPRPQTNVIPGIARRFTRR